MYVYIYLSIYIYIYILYIYIYSAARLTAKLLIKLYQVIYIIVVQSLFQFDQLFTVFLIEGIILLLL